jgi:DNA-binding transcriptional LysR family regulator
MDVLHGLRVFTRVVDAGSFSAVAREMGVTQPTVSKIISQLEAHFGAQLIVRSTAKLKLTDAGAGFYEKGRKLLQDLAALESSVGPDSGQPSGRLRVSAPSAFGEAYLTPMLLKLLETHPALEVDLILNDRWYDLLEEGIDVALRFGPLPDSRIIARRVGTSPQACLASPEYLSRHEAPASLDELEHHSCVVNRLVSPTGRWVFHGPQGEAAVHVGGNFRSNNLEAIRRAVLAGNGIAVGPVWLYYDDIREGRVRVLLPEYKPAPLDINAMYLPSPYLPSKVGVFIAALEAEVRRIPALRGELPQVTADAKRKAG